MPTRRDDLAHLVARRIAALRLAAGLTQEAFAARLDIATKNVQRIESGRQNLTLRTLERVADALGIGRFVLLAAVSSDDVPVDARRSALSVLVDAGFVVVPASQAKAKPAHAVPIVDLQVAAGTLQGAARRVDTLGWTTLPRRGAPPPGYFVAQVRGESMAPRVPDGSVCLFGPPPAAIQGRIALLQYAASVDVERDGAYAIKKVAKLRRSAAGTTHVRLQSLNPAYPPVELTLMDDDELRVVGELVEILAPR